MANKSQETQLENGLKIFLAHAAKKHSNKYTYDVENYKGVNCSIDITCKKHGVFKQMPCNHVKSDVACPKCRKEMNILENMKLYEKIFSETHGEKYLYDWTSWKNSNTKMRIKCATHGWFEQIPYDHIKTNGCRACFKLNHSKILRSPFSSFLKKAHKVHKDRFEYDAKSWQGSRKKLRIKCKEHGWFEQIPNDHLRLQGCRSCSMQNINAMPLGDVLKSFKEKHGSRYSYVKETYVNMGTPMEMICKIHGSFQQKPIEHIKHSGCTKCSGRHRWTTEEFIDRAQKAHHGKYIYEKSVYTGALAKIIVTCPDHGDFVTQPSRHVTKKAGCIRCRGWYRTTEEFILLSKKLFGDRYDYTKTKYTGSGQKITVTCPDHGDFTQKASEHLECAIGCPKCSYNISGKETSWLDSLSLSSQTKRATRIEIDGKYRSVDAYDPKTNTVYEFWGDWWHGNPRVFSKTDVHPKTGTTYGQLYQKTLKKKRDIKKAGYNLVDIWEDEYDKLVKKGLIEDKPKKALMSLNKDNKICLDQTTWNQVVNFLPDAQSKRHEEKQKTLFEAGLWREVHGMPWKSLQGDFVSNHKTVCHLLNGWFKKSSHLKDLFEKIVAKEKNKILLSSKEN